jgi:hypothetical protein
MRTSEQTTTLIAALVTARGSFAPILKNATGHVGKDTPTRYADLAAVLEATIPPLLVNGIMVIQAVDAESSCLITRMQHTSGEWCEAAYPLKLDLPPQQLGSLITYARRYSLLGLLCVAAEDDDGAEATKAKPAPTPKAKPATAKLITEQQRKRLFVIAGNAGWHHDQIKTYLHRHVGIEHTKDIRADQYDALCDVFGTPFEPEGDHA